MRGTICLVANASRGRLVHVVADTLNVLEEYEHSESRKLDRELGTDRPGRFNDEGPGHRSAAEPPTTPHEVELQRFARELGDSLGDHSRDAPVDIVIIAPAHFLGTLKANLSRPVAARLTATVSKDYTALDNRDLADVLRGLGVKGLRTVVPT